MFVKEFTEKHHAFIAAAFYEVLTERFQDRGEAAFIHAALCGTARRTDGAAGHP